MNRASTGAGDARKAPVIRNSDMEQSQRRRAVEVAVRSLERFDVERDIAASIKQEFDKAYNPTWHCIVGRHFGSYVTHETSHFIHFYLGDTAILLFKFG